MDTAFLNAHHYLWYGDGGFSAVQHLKARTLLPYLLEVPQLGIGKFVHYPVLAGIVNDLQQTCRFRQRWDGSVLCIIGIALQRLGYKVPLIQGLVVMPKTELPKSGLRFVLPPEVFVEWENWNNCRKRAYFASTVYPLIAQQDWQDIVPLLGLSPLSELLKQEFRRAVEERMKGK